MIRVSHAARQCSGVVCGSSSTAAPALPNGKPRRDTWCAAMAFVCMLAGLAGPAACLLGGEVVPRSEPDRLGVLLTPAVAWRSRPHWLSKGQATDAVRWGGTTDGAARFEVEEAGRSHVWKRMFDAPLVTASFHSLRVRYRLDGALPDAAAPVIQLIAMQGATVGAWDAVSAGELVADGGDHVLFANLAGRGLPAEVGGMSLRLGVPKDGHRVALVISELGFCEAQGAAGGGAAEPGQSRVEVYVVDQGNRAIAGAAVEAVSALGRAPASAVTGGNGRAVLVLPEQDVTGVLAFRVRKPGCMAVARRVVQADAGTALPFVLGEPRALGGRVTDAQATDLAGCAVYAEALFQAGSGPWQIWTGMSETGQDGSWRIADAPAHPWAITLLFHRQGCQPVRVVCGSQGVALPQLQAERFPARLARVSTEMGPVASVEDILAGADTVSLGLLAIDEDEWPSVRTRALQALSSATDKEGDDGILRAVTLAACLLREDAPVRVVDAAAAAIGHIALGRGGGLGDVESFVRQACAPDELTDYARRRIRRMVKAWNEAVADASPSRSRQSAPEILQSSLDAARGAVTQERGGAGAGVLLEAPSGRPVAASATRTGAAAEQLPDHTERASLPGPFLDVARDLSVQERAEASAGEVADMLPERPVGTRAERGGAVAEQLPDFAGRPSLPQQNRDTTATAILWEDLVRSVRERLGKSGPPEALGHLMERGPAMVATPEIGCQMVALVSEVGGDTSEKRKDGAVRAVLEAFPAGALHAEEARLGCALYWYRESQASRAIQTLDDLGSGLAQSRWRGWSVVLRALCQVQSQSPAAGLATLQAFIKDCPGEPEIAQARFLVGWLHLTSGSKEAAVTELRAVAAAFPGTPHALKAKELLGNLGVR